MRFKAIRAFGTLFSKFHNRLKTLFYNRIFGEKLENQRGINVVGFVGG